MQLQRDSLRFLKYAVDFFCITISFFVSLNYSRLIEVNSITLNENFLFISLVITWYITAHSVGVYDEFRSRDFSFELITIIKTILIQIIITIIMLFLIKEIAIKRTFVFYFAFLMLGLITFNKFIIRKYLYRLRSKGRNLRSLLIVGAGEVGQNFYNSIHSNPHFGYRLIGFLDDNSKVLLNGKYLGKIEQLEEVLEKKRVDDVIIALPNYAVEKLEWVVSICQKSTSKVRIIPDYFKFLSERFEVTVFDKFPIITVRVDKINEYGWRLLKRGFDFFFASMLFVTVLIWLFPLIALGIKFTSRGPVFFKHERWGRNNRRFVTYKFRSMVMESKDVDETGKFKQATKNDSRITKFGSFLRKSNLDELPQFWNVILGDMSVVGPRPHPTPLNLESKDKIRYYQLRHLVKPGVTGWAQAKGYRGETDEPWKMQKRVEHDLWYIENWSFLLDLQIIILTIWNMIKGDKNAY